MKTALRALAGVFAGVLVSFLLVVAVESFSAVVHPFPQDFRGTTEEMIRHVRRYPQWVLAVVVVAWAFAAFVGTWTARRIGNLYPSAIVGLLLLAALVFNLSELPYPTWFKVVNLLVLPTAIVCGVRSPTRLNTASAGEAH